MDDLIKKIEDLKKPYALVTSEEALGLLNEMVKLNDSLALMAKKMEAAFDKIRYHASTHNLTEENPCECDMCMIFETIREFDELSARAAIEEAE